MRCGCYNWKEINIFVITRATRNGSSDHSISSSLSFCSISSVISLSICSTEETFLTSSVDNTLRLWDARIPTSQVKRYFPFEEVDLTPDSFPLGRVFSVLKRLQVPPVVRSPTSIRKVVSPLVQNQTVYEHRIVLVRCGLRRWHSILDDQTLRHSTIR